MCIRDSILAAEFVNKGERIAVIRFSQRGRKDYYTTDSTNVRKAFLRTPIEFARISSHYNPNRKHPVLNTIRAHKGTDYAAKSGTEVVATGDGIVKEAKFSRSYGNYIDIVHYNKYLTRYAHLKDFARGIKKGSKVGQMKIELDKNFDILKTVTDKKLNLNSSAIFFGNATQKAFILFSMLFLGVILIFALKNDELLFSTVVNSDNFFTYSLFSSK